MTKLLPKQFVTAYLSYARQTEVKTGIDARFILAQAALESGWGAATPGNMFFGIKAGQSTPENKRQLITTREVLSTKTAQFPQVISVTPLSNGKYLYVVKDWFRKYDSPEESFTDHANFFLENKRYRKALSVKNDPYCFAEAITEAGYATAPGYADTLKTIIRMIEKNML